METRKYFIQFLILNLFFEVTRTEIVQGVVNTAESWVFLARFCFVNGTGKLEYEVSYPVKYGIESLLLYYDEPDQWAAVYKTQTTCFEKQRVLSAQNGQFINLTLLEYDNAGCSTIQHPTKGMYYNCVGTREFRSARDRWWYIALGNCLSKYGLRLEYKFTFTNARHSFWFKHFSVDEFYIMHTNIIFLIAYIVIMVISIVFSVKLIKKHLFHATYKIFVISVTYKLLSLFLLCLSLGQFAVDGIGYPSIKVLALIAGAASEYLFLLLSILIAKGYTITRGRLRSGSSIKLAVFMVFYCLNYAAIFIYQQLYFDPGKVLYLYESPAGYAIIALRLAGFFWFGYAVLITLQHYKEKFLFYSVYFFCYTIWFLAGPIMIIIATIYIPKWMREKVMNGVDQSIALLAHVGFLILTRPSEANKRFPYHVKTSQIDVMKLSPNGTVGENSIDKFNHQPYPSNDPANRYHVPNYDDLFVVQRPIEMANVENRQANGHLPPIQDFVRGLERNNAQDVPNGAPQGQVSTIYQNGAAQRMYCNELDLPPPYNENYRES